MGYFGQGLGELDARLNEMNQNMVTRDGFSTGSSIAVDSWRWA